MAMTGFEPAASIRFNAAVYNCAIKTADRKLFLPEYMSRTACNSRSRGSSSTRCGGRYMRAGGGGHGGGDMRAGGGGRGGRQIRVGGGGRGGRARRGGGDD